MPSDSTIHAIAGAAGGIVALTVTYPLVFLSTRAAVETQKQQKSTYEVVADILKREGFFGLYSGLSSSLIGIAATNGAYYYFYERSRAAIIKSHQGAKVLSTLESMLAGLIAGSTTCIIVNPLWVIQTCQATHTISAPNSKEPAPKSMGFLETIRYMLRKDGAGAFWRGLGPALVLVVNPVLQYTVFEQLKNVLIKRRTARLRLRNPSAAVAILSDWDFFLLGALSKLVATGSSYPYLVVKSRLQAGHAQALRYKSSLDGLLTILREEGVAGLYKGIGNKLLQSVLTAAILFACQRRLYEITKTAVSR